MTCDTRGRSNPLIRAGWPGLKCLAGSLPFAYRGARPARAPAVPGGRTRRRLCCEPLEARELLDGSGLVEVGAQPDGALTDKIVYVHGGHGWYYNDTYDSWMLQRPELFEMIEDFGNQDQMNFLVDYLFRAGATVVPLRPVGHQLNEVVLDNDDPEVTFVGSWTASGSPTFFGDPGDVAYRFADASATETAYARYQPDIPKRGFYPVYAWALPSSNRVSDQLYRIAHTGGITEVTINHRRVGQGWVYLGQYYFEAGTSGHVDISNRSGDSGAVIADAIRFGNGMGDIDDDGGISGKPREDEAGLYWIEAQLGQGMGSYNIGGTVTAPPRWAAQMNQASDGVMTDRLFFSYHSNAFNGSARGTVGLYNTNTAYRTPNQRDYAELVAEEVTDDLVALNGQFEHDWYDRGSGILYSSSFGEINNTYINDEFDATILEVAFHDNQQDAELMLDPKVRDTVARASYQAIVRYFNQFDGGVTPVDLLPDPVQNVRAIADAGGDITISWQPPTAGGVGGDAATGYQIEMSLDGYGFDGGTVVAGGGSTSHTFTDLDPTAGMYYFRVVAVNDGGASKPSPVVASRPLGGGTSPVLIVDGFDRLGRSQNDRQSYGGGVADRVRQRYANTHDDSVQVGEAIEAFSSPLAVDTVANEAVIAGQVQLANYDTVIWILGEESTVDHTFNTTEQSLVSAFLSGGGNLFVSGAEIGWDLDAQEGGRSFYNNTLKADYVADDANTYSAVGVTGSIFAGLSITFDNGTYFYDTENADVISPLGGATAALNYSGGTPGVAAIQYEATGSEGSLVMLGFPFETILGPITRATVMAAALDLFGTIVLGDMNGDGQVSDLDVAPFMDVLLHGPFQIEADMNEDGVINGLDIGPFQAAVVGGASASTAAVASGAAEVAIEADVGVGARQPRTGSGTTSVWYVAPGVQRQSVAMVHPTVQTARSAQTSLPSDDEAGTRPRRSTLEQTGDLTANQSVRRRGRLGHALARPDTQRELAAVWAQDHDWLRDEVWSHRRR